MSYAVPDGAIRTALPDDLLTRLCGAGEFGRFLRVVPPAS